MPSTASTTTDASVEDRILDAALVQFERVGVKKTTVEDIARQADVDRVTVYRRIGSRDEVVRAVTAREVQRLLDELHGIPARHESFEAIVADVFVTVVTRWRTHPMVQKLMVLEPERLLPQLTTQGGPFFAMSVMATTEILRKVLHDRGFPDITDLPARVEVTCRIVHSMILQPMSALDLESDEALAAFAHDYIVPILTR